MKLLPHQADRTQNSVLILAGLALLFILVVGARAQTPPAESTPSNVKGAASVVETIHLAHVTAQRDLNDVQTDLRNMLPTLAIYAVQTQNAVSIRGTPEDIETARKLIAELDRPRRAYKVTYTFTETDNGKAMGVHHLTLIVLAGEKSVAKQGDRVPIVTGTFDKENAAQNSQVQYLDVGLNIEASLDGDRLRSKVEQTSVSDERSGIGAQDPIVRQTSLEATSDVTPGRSFVLGSIDIHGTTRHEEIEAVAEHVQ
jgi:type II secretory pathway component GspD/PulD (secretin)